MTVTHYCFTTTYFFFLPIASLQIIMATAQNAITYLCQLTTIHLGEVDSAKGYK